MWPPSILGDLRFAQVFALPDNVPIDGIIYTCAVMPAGKNIVLFLPHHGRRRFDEQVSLMSALPVEAADWKLVFQLIKA